MWYAKGRRKLTHGWRGKIGLVGIDATHRDSEYWKYVPDGVELFITRIALPKYDEWTWEVAAQVAEGSAIEAAAKTVAVPHPQCIAFACTAISFARGPGLDKEISERIEKATGIPATTTSTSIVAALRHLGTTKVAVATPYNQGMTEKLVKFLEGNDIEVVGSRSLDSEQDLPLDVLRRFTLDADFPSADAVVFSCTNYLPLRLIEPLEEDLGKPLVTASQAMMWETLRISGIRARRPDLGRLFQL